MLAACVLVLTGSAALAAKRVALVIGNSAYTLAPLENPKNDADDVTAALKRLGFEVAERKDLSIRDFDRALDNFILQAEGADVALFFFSGHGVQIDKRGYLAPTDVKAESESSALRELIAVQEAVSRIESAAKISVIVLDACRDSPLQERVRRISLERSKNLTPVKGLPQLSVVGSNTLVVYATVPGETASDGPGQRNSPFTTALLANIETPGLEIEALFKRVTSDVLSATGGRQQPERLSRLQDELILLPAASASELQAPLSEAARAWNDVKGSADASVIETFREVYGRQNPLYDKLASQRVTALKDKLAAEGGGASSTWPWSSGPKPEPAKPGETQTAFVVPRPRPALPAEPACDGLLVSTAMDAKRCIKLGSGESFKDCPDCPEMVLVPDGRFTMGSPGSEPEHQSDETQHDVLIAKPFAVGQFAVTFGEWDACVADGGCGGYSPKDEGWGRGDRPVINVNWDDAKAYVAWLSKKTGKSYRLLSEAEFEYAARAGTRTPFWWGTSIAPKQANYDGSAEPYKGGGQKGEYRQKTLPVKSFKPNPWGLYQVHGNVWSWTEDCYLDSSNGAPSDGSAWTAGACKSRVLRGGSWYDVPVNLRAAFRLDNAPVYRGGRVGLRVARTSQP